jgi:hypothetical protein
VSTAALPAAAAPGSSSSLARKKSSCSLPSPACNCTADSSTRQLVLQFTQLLLPHGSPKEQRSNRRRHLVTRHLRGGACYLLCGTFAGTFEVLCVSTALRQGARSASSQAESGCWRTACIHVALRVWWRHLVEGRCCQPLGAAALVGLRDQRGVRCLGAGKAPQPGALGIKRRLRCWLLRLSRPHRGCEGAWHSMVVC